VSRIPHLTPADLDPAQRELYDEIVDGPRGKRAGARLLSDDGSLRGPFNPLLLSPVVGSPFQRIGAAIRFETELADDLRELAILLVASAWNCEFEWRSHVPIALRSGIREEVIEALAAGDDPTFDTDEQALVQLASQEILTTRTISDRTFVELERALGRRSTFELLATFGYYSMLALVLNGYDVRFD